MAQYLADATPLPRTCRSRAAAVLLRRVPACGPDSADTRALRYARDQLQAGELDPRCSPKGAPGWGSPLGDFLEGAGHLGLTPGVTVMPAAIWGVHHLMRGWRPVGRGPVLVAFGHPVPVPETGPRRERAAELTRRTRAAIAGAARADDAGPPVIAHAAPPPPVISAPAVSFGRVAVRVGPRTERVEVQADGRITARLRPPPGPRRVSVPVPTGIHPVRVRAIGRGGARWSATVRVRALPRSALRPGRIPGFVDRRLQRDVERLASGMPAVTGVYVQHLVTGCGAAVNADAQFPAASTLKAAILVDAVRRGAGRVPGTDPRPDDHRLGRPRGELGAGGARRRLRRRGGRAA